VGKNWVNGFEAKTERERGGGELGQHESKRPRLKKGVQEGHCLGKKRGSKNAK